MLITKVSLKNVKRCAISYLRRLAIPYQAFVENAKK